MFVRAYLRASTAEQDATHACAALVAFLRAPGPFSRNAARCMTPLDEISSAFHRPYDQAVVECHIVDWWGRSGRKGLHDRDSFRVQCDATGDGFRQTAWFMDHERLIVRRLGFEAKDVEGLVSAARTTRLASRTSSPHPGGGGGGCEHFAGVGVSVSSTKPRFVR